MTSTTHRPPAEVPPIPPDRAPESLTQGPGPSSAGERGSRWTRVRTALRGPRRPRPGRTPLPPHLRRRRRRLLLGSTPFVAVLLLVAARLLSLNLVHAQTLAAYESGDRAGTQAWAERQGWVNVVEQFRSPFAIGDAYILTGHFDLARPWFEQAFEQVPKGGIDDCKVRVNLGLTYEKLGDAAKARERTTEWQQYYAKGIQITKERPPLCDAPEQGEQTGQQLQDAQQRMEEKNGGAEPPPQPQPQPTPAPGPQPTPQPDPDNTPSERRQQQLQEQQRRNTIERNLRNNGPDVPGGGPQQPYPKPW